jgi:hypothetical protein
MAAAFEYRQAEEIRDVFARHRIGFADTTQDADLFADKSQDNCSAVVVALRDLGF